MQPEQQLTYFGLEEGISVFLLILKCKLTNIHTSDQLQFGTINSLLKLPLKTNTMLERLHKKLNRSY